MPHIVKFLLINAAIGFAAATAFVGGLVALDINGLRTLMLQSDAGGVALAVLIFFTGLTFASAQMGMAVMRLSDGKDAPPKRRGGRGPDDHFPPDGPGNGGGDKLVRIRVRSNSGR